MRIGVCARTWGERGGIGVYTRNLLRSMLPLGSGHEFTVYYNDRTHVGQFTHLPHVREFHVSAPHRGVWDQVSVPLAAERHGIDVLFHTKFSVPLISRIKTAMVLHGSERFVYPQFSHRTDVLYFRTLYPLCLRRASAIVSVSENARRDVIRYVGLSPDKVHTVHLAASGAFRKIDDGEALMRVRQRYGLPRRFILNVGLIYPGKNLPNLLRALRLVRRHEDVALVVAGAGRRMYADDLRLIRELGLEDAVVMAGYVPHEDLVAVYNLAELVAFPSFYESFPAIPLEAHMCDCPVVTSRTGGTPEAAGEGACYVDPFDPADIAEGILRVLVTPALRSRLIESGRRNVTRFSWQKTASETLAVLETLAPAPSS